MKKSIILAVAFAMIFGAGIGSASAANSLTSGSTGISVGMGDSVFGKVAPSTVVSDVVNISGRYLIANDMAIMAGIGLQMLGGDADGTYISLSAGGRKYLKTADFAPFIGGRLTFATMDDDQGLGDDTDVIDLEVSFGAEYFIGPQFSLEGSVGAAFGQVSVGNADATYFGTRTVGVFANLYF